MGSKKGNKNGSTFLTCKKSFLKHVCFFQKRCQGKHEYFKNIDVKHEKNATLKSTTGFLVITGY